MRVGITGHQKLEDSENWSWVKKETNDILAQIPKPLIGVTSLAVGADQLFAKTILENGGSLTVIIPFEGYEFIFEEGNARKNYHYFLKQATTVDILSKMASDEESYFEAGKQVVDRVDLLIAVWDGKPAKGLGGTGDVVKYAQYQNKNIIQLNSNVYKVLKI